jgi:hypothetical protein
MNGQKSKPLLIMSYNKAIVLTFFIFFFAYQASAQVNRYMIFFKDKSDTDFSTSKPFEFLSQKAIDRRLNQGLIITQQDFPVNQSYVQQLRDAGTNVFFKSRWMNGVLVQCDETLLPSVQALDFVQKVEFVAPGSRLINGRKKLTSESKDGSSDAATLTQLAMLGIDSMHQQGYRGEGITIAVLDAGFPGVNSNAAFQEMLNEGRINLIASYDFVFNTNDVFQYDSHGAKVFSIIGGHEAGKYTGSAYRANFQLYVTEDEDSEYRVEEYNWLFAAERADSSGVDIISTSLGYNTFDDSSMDYQQSDLDGTTAVITQAAQWAADRGILVVCSAGNEGNVGWKLITPPADAKDVLAIANVNAQGVRSGSSSIGLENGDYIKPDLAALGVNVSLVNVTGSLGAGSGTSYAAPLVTGLVAGIWQKHPALTNKELINVLKHTASQSKTPDHFLGYGIPNFTAVENYLAFNPDQPIFTVYPNPFTSAIHIRPNNPEELTFGRAEILNTQGQVTEVGLITFNWLAPAYEVSFASLSPGMYFLRIYYGTKIFVTKIVKR